MSDPQTTRASATTEAVLFAGAAGLGALLLFQVQLVLGKRLLPWFGGTSALWTTCLLFFQSALLAGYAWAHLLASRLPTSRQRDLHLLLLAAAAGVLAWHAAAGWPSPITPGDTLRPLPSEIPVVAALGRLAASIGLPFVALAATSPLLQAWFASVNRSPASPFWLFALSNGGSLAGLLSYPWLVEPHVSLTSQGRLWSAAFAVFGLLMVACAWLAGRGVAPASAEPVDRPLAPTADAPAGLWLALSTVPSLLLLAVTSHLTQEVAAVPLLWMLPLAVYLLTLVLCFGWPAATPRAAWGAIAAAAGVAAAVGLHRALVLGVRGRTFLWLGVLFAYGMACHGELVRARPGARRLTAFYLTVAAGGALGGVLCGLAAPFLLDGYWELHAAILGGPLVLAVAGWRLPPPGEEDGPGRVRLAAAAAVYLLALGVWLTHDVVASHLSAEVVQRGFYGALRVEREAAGTPEEALKLMHGRIAHGLQLVDAARRTEPTTYFGPTSGVGLAIRRHPRRLRGEPLRIGIVGLGVGTLASWARPGDTVRFYELDPDVVSLSQGPRAVFTYLRDSAGRVSVAAGDGRLSLEREPPAGYDVLVLDAFSSDAIPTHLLTREAFSVYLRHLRPDGVLAVQVTNRYVDLKPVVRGVAAGVGLRAVHVPSFERGVLWSSDWMLVGRGGGVLDDELVSAASLPPLGGATVVWTDDWSDLVSVLRR